METSFGIVLVTLVVIAIIYYLVKNLPMNSVNIQPHIEDGRRTFTSKTSLPKSFNEKEGLSLSFTCWVKIDDFAFFLLDIKPLMKSFISSSCSFSGRKAYPLILDDHFTWPMTSPDLTTSYVSVFAPFFDSFFTNLIEDAASNNLYSVRYFILMLFSWLCELYSAFAER